MSIAVAAAATLAAAQPTVGGAPDYALPQNWICLPDRSDICSRPVTAHELTPSGWGERQVSRAAPDAPVDCFYIYPTASSDSGMNSDLAPGKSEELLFTQIQFARFSSVCRPFVPTYRQMTTSSVAMAAIGMDIAPYAATAYNDVVDAWRDYIANRNDGRPFVLIGHSQGSIMLEQLVRNEIEGSPAHDRMLRAILPGWNIMVPQGKTVGGSFQQTPACTAPGQTRCVMSWSTYGAGSAPAAGALFGYAEDPALQPICTNPANERAGKGWAAMDGFYFAKSSYPVKGGPIRWSSEGPPPGPFAVSEDFLEGQCVQRGQRGYLQVRIKRAAGDTRSDRIGGEVGIGGMFLPGWGKHLIDMAAPQDDLIALVARLGREARRDD